MPLRIGPKKPVRVYLAARREEARLSQEQVGERIGPNGVSKGTVSRWENAKRVPSSNVLAAYAEAIGCHVADLFRPPNQGPSLDAMIADEPADVREHVINLVSALTKRGKAA